jgi:hypothetical protein
MKTPNLKWLTFLKAIYPDLIEVGKALFKAFDGDAAKSKAALKRIPDYWAGIDEERAKVDAELKELQQQGK